MIETPPPSPQKARLPLFNVALLLLPLGLGGFFLVGIPAQMLSLPWGLWVTEVFVFLGLPVLMLRATGRAPLEAVGLARVEPRLLAFGFAVGAVNYFAWAVPLMFVASKVFPAEVLELFNSAAVFEHRTRLELVMIVSAVSVAAPVCEEAFFRGGVQQGLSPQLGPGRAVVLTAVLFSIFHFDPVGFVARVELGLVFGLLLLRSRSLSASIGAHMANNMVSAATYFAAGGDTEGELPWQVAAGMAVVGNLLLAGLWEVAKRWPTTLTSAAPANETDAPPAPLWSLALPWLLCAAAAAGALFALDSRGVALNLVDVAQQLPRLKPDAGAEERAAREALYEARQQARKGELSVEQYRARRREAAARPAPAITTPSAGTPSGAPDAGG